MATADSHQCVPSPVTKRCYMERTWAAARGGGTTVSRDPVTIRTGVLSPLALALPGGARGEGTPVTSSSGAIAMAPPRAAGLLRAWPKRKERKVASKEGRYKIMA
jgi:hypothetical protein